MRDLLKLQKAAYEFVEEKGKVTKEQFG